MKANEPSLNDLNFIKLEKYFQNENENEFETVVTFENEIKIPNENENENELGNGNETSRRNENGNELENEPQTLTGNETRVSSGNELISQMHQEILFYSHQNFSMPQQTIPNPRMPQDKFQVIVVGKSNIKPLWRRYYDTIEYLLLQEYLTTSEIEDFKLASSRFDKLNTILLEFKELEYLFPLVDETEEEETIEKVCDNIEEEIDKLEDKKDLFEVIICLLLILSAFVVIITIIQSL